MTKQEMLDYLEKAKNYWSAIHIAADHLAEGTKAGRIYLLLEGAAGGTIVDTANGDTLDEQIVGTGGDIVGGILFDLVPFGVGFAVNVSMTASGYSPGDIVKSYYKDIKADASTQYWKYEKDFYYMKAGQMLHLDYAKVLYDTNGAVFDAGDQVVQETYESQYNQYIQDKEAIDSISNNALLNTFITNENGIFQATLPDNSVIAEVTDDILAGTIKKLITTNNTNQVFLKSPSYEIMNNSTTLSLTTSDLADTSAVIDSVFSIAGGSTTPKDVTLNLSDTGFTTTLKQGDLLYDLATKTSVDVGNILKNNAWLINQDGVSLSDQYFASNLLDSPLATLQSTLNAGDLTVTKESDGSSILRGDGNTIVTTNQGAILQYDPNTNQLILQDGQYQNKIYTINAVNPVGDDLLSSISESLASSDIAILPAAFTGSVSITPAEGQNDIVLSAMTDASGNVIGTSKALQTDTSETLTQSYFDSMLPQVTTVQTNTFTARYEDGKFQGFTTINGENVSQGINAQFVQSLSDQGLGAPSESDLQNLINSPTDNPYKTAFDNTVATGVNGTDYYGNPKIITQSESTLQLVGNSVASLTDALSIVKAIQSGNPIPIVATGLRLASDIDHLDGKTDLPNLGAAASIGGSIMSIYSLADELDKGDALGAVTSAGYAVVGAAEAAKFLASSGAISEAPAALESVGSTVGNVLPYLSIVNSIAHGDMTGVGVSLVDMAMMKAGLWSVPYVGWAYAIFSVVSSLFGGDDIPDPWGTGRYVWDGTSIKIQSAGETGGNEAVSGVMQNVLNAMNALIEQQRQTNPTSALGIIPERMPTIAYDMSGYRYTDIDPLTGEQLHPSLRFDTSGNPYNATPGSTESYQSLGESIVRSALARDAIAPMWEVQTAKMQSDAGDPKAGLTEEARAGRDGALAAALSGDTQVFRPVALDLNGNGTIDTISKDTSGVSFDVDDSGYLKQTAWVNNGDAFLTLDRNYNGEIDSGKEMFSNSAVALNRRGLAGLGWVDANYDGKITSADPVWSELRVWQDANQDGVEEASESMSLDDLGITELNYAMGTFTQNGVKKLLSSPDLTADTQGVKVSVVPEGILVDSSTDGISLIVTRVDDNTVVQANQDGVSGYEDTEMIINGADLVANDTLGGVSGRDLTLTGVSNFKHGSGYLDANGYVHFIPEANYAGSDAGFEYTSTATANGQSGTGNVVVTLQNVNDAPTLDHVDHTKKAIYGYQNVTYQHAYAGDDAEFITGQIPIYTPYDGHTTPIAYEDSGAGDVIGTDVDDPASSLQYDLVNGPQYGAVTLNPDGTFQYTSWKEPNVASDRIMYNGQYGAISTSGLNTTIYTQNNLPGNAVYPTTDTFQVKITDPHGASTIENISVPHYGPYLPPSPSGGGGKKPIAVDLGGDGFNFTNINDSNVFFDVTGDGWKRKTAWVSPNDGLLAYDSDGNGKIETSNEISFVSYKDGAQSDLEGLKAFDTNGDGIFSAADKEWNKFGVWQDKNQNGITDAGEFKTLSDMGVASIKLSSDGKFSVVNDQTVHGIGSMQLENGNSMAIADVTLQYSNETQVTKSDGTTTSVTPTTTFSPDGEEIDGTEGKDLILGKSGNNIINAYGGDDVIFDNGGNDVIDAGAGNDIVYAGADNDIVFGRAGDDMIYGGLGDDMIFGGDGNDVIFADGGNDVVFAGDGNDMVSGGDGNDVISGDGGDDQLYGEGGNDALFGRDGNDQLFGMDGNDLLNGGKGDDFLDGGAGADTMIGGEGNDTYVVDSVDDVITEAANEGNDTVISSIDYILSDNLENLTLSGSENLNAEGNNVDNILIGNSGNNTITGKAGNDTLDGGAGIDTLIGGTGDDTYIVDNVADTVVEALNEGYDTVKSSVSYTLSDNVEKMILTGTEAINATGNALDNVLIGNSADNILDGKAGADTMMGGAGNDTYVVDNVDDVIVENASEGIDTVLASVSRTLEDHVENLILTGTDVINGTGNNLDNILIGNSANNVLDGKAGNDTLDGGAGIDTLIGGTGNDTYIVDNVGDTVIEALNEGTDTIISSVSYVLPENVENITLSGSDNINATGNDLNNTIIGNSGNNILDGKAGADTMIGHAGDDTYVVDNVADTVIEALNEGYDTIKSSVSYTLSDNVEKMILTGTEAINATGNALDNVLIGNSADNILDGKAGADTMIGHAGDDTYIVDNVADTIVEALNEGYDTVQSSVSYTLSANIEKMILTGDNSINANGNNLDNVLIGNSTDNILDGKAGIDTMIGGNGNDTYYVDNTADIVKENANEGIDTVYSSANYTLSDNVENMTLLGTENINATGNDLNNTIIGNSANNVLDGKAGADTMMGGTGDDTYIVDNVADTIIEAINEGIDTIKTSVTYTASANIENLELLGNESIDGTGNDLNNTIIGNSANNVLDGKAGADTMIGHAGDDTYIVDNIGDTVVEALNEGTDTIISSVSYVLPENVENITLSGTDNISATGNDLDNILIGNSGDNTITGKAGNDTLDGGTGIDTLIGGMGDDTYIVDNVGDTVVEALNEGYDTVKSSVSYTLSDNVEKLILTGTDAINGTGNDLDNTIIGNSANNILDGKAGIDTMIGHAGDDTYIVDNVADTVVEALNEGYDTVKSSVSYTLSDNVEKLILTGTDAINGTGNDLDNTIIGNSANNILDGKAGIDTLIGGKGDDTYYVDNTADIVKENANEGIDTVYSSANYTLSDNVENLTLIGTDNISAIGNDLANILIGNNANNYLSGGVGDDLLDGKDGNNILEGGSGNDTLIGGLGNDTYVINMNDGLDKISDKGGDDTVRFTDGFSLDNVALRVVDNNGTLTAQVRVLNAGGCEQSDQGFDFAVTKDAQGNYVSPIEHFTFSDGSDKTFDDLLIKTEVTYASFWQKTIVTGRNDDIIYGNFWGNTIYSGTGNDIVYAGMGGDQVYGQGGNDTLLGGFGDDMLNGGCGTDIMSGSFGRDTLIDTLGNNAFLGGSQNDVITAGNGNDFIAGGSQDDILNGGGGNNVFAFNMGDGKDTILPVSGAHNTLSLNDVNYRDISLSRKNDDLVVNAGWGSQITLKSWYASQENQNFDTLQIVSSQYDYSFSRDKGFSVKETPDVETFDFKALVNAFDTAKITNSRCNSRWSAMDAMLQNHLSSSDSAALGGDLAFSYAKDGDLSRVTIASAQDTLNNPNFGSAAQNITVTQNQTCRF